MSNLLPAFNGKLDIEHLEETQGQFFQSISSLPGILKHRLRLYVGLRSPSAPYILIGEGESRGLLHKCLQWHLLSSPVLYVKFSCFYRINGVNGIDWNLNTGSPGCHNNMHGIIQ